MMLRYLINLISIALTVAATIVICQPDAVSAQLKAQQDRKPSPDISPSIEKEPAYLHMSIANLVLSQTGNSDQSKQDRLCDGDLLMKWDGQELRDNDHLVELWLASWNRKQVPLTVQRKLPTGVVTLRIDYSIRFASQLFTECTKGGRSQYLQPAELFPDLESIEQLPLKSIASEVLGGEAATVQSRLAQAFQRLTDFTKGHYRSDHVVYLLNRPFHCEAWSRKQCDAIANSTSASEMVASLWQLANPEMRLLKRSPKKENKSPQELQALCELISEEVAAINRHYRRATSGFSEAEKHTWNQWCRQARPLWRGEQGWDEFAAGFQLTKKLDVDSFESAVAAGALLADELSPGGSLFDALKSLAPPSESTIIDRVLVGSVGNDHHQVTTPVIIDFGGDDRYSYPDTGMDPGFPVRFVVDLSGNDHYSGSTNAIAAGVAGISVLIDAAGNDDYETVRNGIGYAVCGLGLLIDKDGHDHYRGQTFAQGAAMVGVGMIVDSAGNDRYHAGSYSQSIGLPGGCGAIFDQSGDDVYTCTGRVASPYGDQGEYEGMGQGCGFGYRYLGCGGVGILIDAKGRDFYRAGQFALGCGYFYGIGLVNDRDGDDVFECSRYGLGSAAHYGVGLVLDDNGNDYYSATRRSAVAELGSSWDLSLGALIDSSGDDIYRAATYALGGAAQNAYGFMWDKSGNDHYLVGTQVGEALGYSGGSTYGAGRGARNLAIFLDESGDDVYSAAGSKNGASMLRGEFAIQVDR